jgi:heme/copper-type cytochrome/quinol oxidase subunit 3
MKKNLFSLLLPLLIAACIIAILTVLAWDALRTKHIEPVVVMVANAILLLTSCLNIFFQQVNLTKSNPQAVMRGIIGATMFKLFFLASVVIVYLVAAGEKRSVYAILVSMGCYIVYSWIETRISLQMKSNK